jgi:hypothetical protein
MSFSYARGEFSSFVGPAPRPYIQRMKNRYPTAQELYALEQEARRLRALEMARLFRAGANAVRSLFNRSVTVRNAKGLEHA